MRDDGGLSAKQAKTLVRLYRTRNRLQHASLDVQADEMYDDVKLLRQALRTFVKSYVAWLAGHGLEILPHGSQLTPMGPRRPISRDPVS